MRFIMIGLGCLALASIVTTSDAAPAPKDLDPMIQPVDGGRIIDFRELISPGYLYYDKKGNACLSTASPAEGKYKKVEYRNDREPVDIKDDLRAYVKGKKQLRADCFEGGSKPHTHKDPPPPLPPAGTGKLISMDRALPGDEDVGSELTKDRNHFKHHGKGQIKEMDHC